MLAYAPCNAASPAGSTHNPANLPGDACIPPVQYTPRLTAGDPGVNGSPVNFRGSAKIRIAGPPTCIGCPVSLSLLFPGPDPMPPPQVNNRLEDVRCTPAYAAGSGAGVCSAAGSGNVLIAGGASPNPDYTGDLHLGTWVRITDQANSGPAPSGPYNHDATTKDLFFGVPMDCSVTSSMSIGATCLPRYTDAKAMCSCIVQNKRTIYEVGVGTPSATLPGTGGIFVMDGGSDGNVDPPGTVPTEVPAVDPDSPAPFARQGLFAP